MGRPLVRRVPGVVVDEREVVDADGRLLIQCFLSNCKHFIRCRRSARRQRAVQDERGPAVLLRQVRIAARHREPVRLAHGRDTDDLDADIEVAHHPPDQRELLRVFLAEDGDVGADEMQQLRNDGQDAVEMTRPMRAFVLVAD